MNFEELSNDNDTIVKNLFYLEKNINKINNKILHINSIYKKIEGNKILVLAIIIIL